MINFILNNLGHLLLFVIQIWLIFNTYVSYSFFNKQYEKAIELAEKSNAALDLALKSQDIALKSQADYKKKLEDLKNYIDVNQKI